MALDVDWSSIEHVCWTRSVALEPNDDLDRPTFDDEGPVTHKDICWLGKNYEDQPEKRKLGCDQGCIKEAANKRSVKVSWVTVSQLFPAADYPTDLAVARADWEERRMLVAELEERKKH